MMGPIVHHSKFGCRLTAQGQTLPSRDFCGTAALPLKPDVGWRGWHVRKVPSAPKASSEFCDAYDPRSIFRTEPWGRSDLQN
jgi:hypothetical protein